MSERYVLSNEVRSTNGETLGKFSSHVTAFCALNRISQPNYTPLAGWLESDLKEFEAMKSRIGAAQS